MQIRDFLVGRPRRRGNRAGRRVERNAPVVESLEARTLLTVTTNLVGDTLFITGSPGPDQIEVLQAGRELLVRDSGAVVARVPVSAVNTIEVDAVDGNNHVQIAHNVNINSVLKGGPGNDTLIGGAGNDVLDGGGGINRLTGGQGFNVYINGTIKAPLPGLNLDMDTGLFLDNQVTASPTVDLDGRELTLVENEVQQLLDRASAASPSKDAIIAIVDNGGRILGVRIEENVSSEILNDPVKLTFAVDGAVAKARTGAFFANNTAPLTSRTVQNLSESTILQREVESNPNVTDPNSVLRGPGTMARIGLGGHFPRGVNFTPQVDLAQIEHTNRDTTFHPGPDRIMGTADDVRLPNRFNIPDEAIPERIRSQNLFIEPPDSFGFTSGIHPGAQPRGIATLPGGLPILRAFRTEINGLPRLRTSIVGGLGVFFPGTSGFATEENSILNGVAFDPSRPDRTLEAETIAIAALGGIVDVTKIPMTGPLVIGDLGGVPRIENIVLPAGRIDLVGITLDIYGGHGLQGIQNVRRGMEALGIRADSSEGVVNGTNLLLLRDGDPFADPVANPGALDLVPLRSGQIVPEGFLVEPRDAVDGSGLTADDVLRITAQSVVQSNQTRAAIRLPLDESSRMVIGVTDLSGNVLGLYRMPGATYFSIDVSVAKARNVAYYANANALKEVDRIPGVPPGTAFTSRTIRFASLPFFPSGQDNYPPGPFSKLNDGQTPIRTAVNAGPPLPASAFQSVNGFDAFNPQTNFRDDTNILNQNGIIFFPGSAALYKDVDGSGIRQLVGGFGISGDGVDQDDVVTTFGAVGYEPPFTVPRSDFTFFRGVRLPYIKFNRQPLNRQFEIPQTFPALGVR